MLKRIKNSRVALFLAVLLSTMTLLTSCISVKDSAGGSFYPGYQYMQTIDIGEQIDEPAWTANHYVDEFKQKTDEAYVLAYGFGTFSNSATNGSFASMKVLIDEDSIGFELFEYDVSLPVTVGIYENVLIRVRVSDDETFDLGNIRTTLSGKRIVSYDGNRYSNADRFFKALVENESIQVFIKIYSTYGSSSSYLFTLSGRGFAQSYREAFPLFMPLTDL